VMALAEWRRGNQDKARGWFRQATASMAEQNAKNPTARQLWSETAVLLGQPGPAGAGMGAAEFPAQEKPR
jgi:hypothetical protein